MIIHRAADADGLLDTLRGRSAQTLPDGGGRSETPVGRAARCTAGVRPWPQRRRAVLLCVDGRAAAFL